MATVETTTRTTVVTAIQPNKAYLRTNGGILKIIELVLDLIGVICIVSSGYSSHSRAGWFYFCAITAFWVTGILLFFHVCNCVQRFSVVPWAFGELVYCALWSFLYLTAAAAVLDYGIRFNNLSSWIAAAVFGFLAMIVYGYDAWIRFRLWRGGVVVTTTTQTV